MNLFKYLGFISVFVLFACSSKEKSEVKKNNKNPVKSTKNKLNSGKIPKKIKKVKLKPVNPPVKKIVQGINFSLENKFKKKLMKTGDISIKDFVKKYGDSKSYLSKISYSPMKSKFLPEIQKSYYKMDEKELKLYEKNGFVVSTRRGDDNFTIPYYRIFKYHIPVFITADSILHAWHKTFDSLLMEFEQKILHPNLQKILKSMAKQTTSIYKNILDKKIKVKIKEIDEYIAVALSLLSDSVVLPVIGDKSKVEKLFNTINDLKQKTVNLFGLEREIDFSQFKPRGHYTKTPTLKKYFKAMLWLSQVKLEIRTGDVNKQKNEILTSLTIHEIYKKAKIEKEFKEVDNIISLLIGNSVEATLETIRKIKRNSGLKDLNQLSEIVLTKIKDQIDNDKKIPSKFAFLGQKFILDGWGMEKLVYDKIKFKGRKIKRLIPSSLDVAFSVFNNKTSVETIKNGLKRVPYQNNLVATKETFDSIPEKDWFKTIYTAWLYTLRSLSNFHKNKKLPEVFRTKAWGNKVINTQLGSWTQLRHDTILYAMFSYGTTACYYPHGYVEPKIEFWSNFQLMVNKMTGLFEGLSSKKTGNKYLRSSLFKKRIEHLKFFSQILGTLKDIVKKQNSGKKLSEKENNILKNVVQIESPGSGPATYNGWYPKLFLTIKDCKESIALISDVFTLPPKPGFKGGVLHEAVGRVDNLYISIKNGKDIITYMGPAFSHYEFFNKGLNRLNDNEWKKKLKERKEIPKRPTWTKSYLVDSKK
jgi:Protein of unknown function (DUF3160)